MGIRDCFVSGPGIGISRFRGCSAQCLHCGVTRRFVLELGSRGVLASCGCAPPQPFSKEENPHEGPGRANNQENWFLVGVKAKARHKAQQPGLPLVSALGSLSLLQLLSLPTLRKVWGVIPSLEQAAFLGTYPQFRLFQLDALEYA